MTLQINGHKVSSVNEGFIYCFFVLLTLGGLVNLIYGTTSLAKLIIAIFTFLLLIWMLISRYPIKLRAYQRVLLVYIAISLLNHVLVNGRPHTFLEVLVGPGVVLVLSILTIRFTHFDKLVIYYLLLLLPISLFVFYSGWSGDGLIPYQGGRMMVNLGWVKSKHFTGGMGLLLLLLPFWRRYLQQEVRWIHKFAFLAGAYFIFFSNSRGYILSALLFLFCYYFVVPRVASSGRLRKVTVGIFVLALSVALLFGDLAPQLFSNLPLNLGLTEVEGGRSEITAGRVLLVARHMTLFFDNWFWGVGEFSLSDYFIKGLSEAESESYLTYVMARDGIWGLMNILFLLVLIFEASRSKSRFHYAYAIALLPIISYLGGITTMYQPMIFLNLALLFTWNDRLSRSFNEPSS